ncbi:MAG: hypothetical protein ACRDJU_10360 [Actinomycetota bacterium]
MAAGLLAGPPGSEGLRVLDLSIRTAMTKLGARLMEAILGLDAGHRGQHVDCGHGHVAEFVGYRPKTLDSVLGPLTLRRAWYHCQGCGSGFAPMDNELGVAHSSLTPGLRMMLDRVGAHEPFASARRDLAELAGLDLSTKRVERCAEADGELVREAVQARATAVLAGAVVPIGAGRPVEKLYVAMDGTGVPTVAAENEGRAGKAADGRAHTREVKRLGAVSPRAPWTTRAARSETRTHPATWPPSPPPLTSVRSSTPRPLDAVSSVPPRSS